MYAVITYDCRDEEVRRKVRSLLRRYSFTMLTYSAYVGRCSKGLADRLASSLSKLLGEGDRATLVLLSDFQYELLMEVGKGSVSIRGGKKDVIVIYGRRRSERRVPPNEGSRRPQHMRAQGSSQSGDPARQ